MKPKVRGRAQLEPSSPIGSDTRSIKTRARPLKGMIEFSAREETGGAAGKKHPTTLRDLKQKLGVGENAEREEWFLLFFHCH